jgi:hypothetical protein
MGDARRKIEKMVDEKKKKAKHGGEKESWREMGFCPFPFIEGGQKSLILSVPTLTIAHGSHNINAWQLSCYPNLFPHLVEFKAPGRAPESPHDPLGLQRTQVPSHWHARSGRARYWQHGPSCPM